MLPVAPSESSQGGLASPSEFARDLGPLVGAIDQGLTSSRFLVFSASTAELVTYHQEPVATSSPRPGWVEQDPAEILESVRTCIDATVDNLRKLDGEKELIAFIRSRFHHFPAASSSFSTASTSLTAA